jgi:hypothetical protein
MIKRTADEVMITMPEGWKYRWCESPCCACLGCVNHRFMNAGLSKKDWEKWVEDNPKEY